MTRRTAAIAITLALLAGATTVTAQQYLYAPKPVDAEQKPRKDEGVLVREVAVKKGDTLYGLSRTLSGHGMYYPQILLFNDIKDPNRIYPGEVFRVPVSGGADTARIDGAALKPPSTVVQVPDRAGATRQTGDLKKPAVSAARPARSAKPPVSAADASTEQKLYERAIRAYRQDDYRAALELFDRFLADHPSSVLAADVSLYKAECYLKQSNQ
jgi:nucleoid-associated protein YgaU